MANNNRKWISDITIENARLHYHDFQGRKYGNGARSVGVTLTKEQADELAADGWKVKVLEATEDFPEEKYYINVKIKYGTDRNGNYRAPSIYMIAGDSMVLLDEQNVAMLDQSEIENIDLTFGPNIFQDQITAYLKKMYVTIRQDALAQKYARFENKQVGPVDDFGDEEELPF